LLSVFAPLRELIKLRGYAMQEKEIKLTDYIDFLFRYKWTIIICTLVILVSTLVFTLVQAPVYRSSSTFMIEMTDVGVNRFEQFSFVNKVRPMGFYQAVIKSRKFRVNVAQKLIKNDTVSVTLGEALKLVKENLSLRSSVISEMYELEAQTNDPLLTYLLAFISTNAFKLRCQDIDQEESQNMVNFIENQMNVAKDKLETSERELQEFKEKSNISFVEDGGLLNKLVEFENQLTEVQTQKELASANLEALNLRLEDRRGDVAATLINSESPEVIQLRNEVSQLEDQKNELLQQAGKNNSQITQLDNKIENKKRELVQKVIESVGGIKQTNIGEKSILENMEERKINEELNLYIMVNRERFYNSLITNFKSQHPNLLEHTMEMARLSRAKTVSEILFTFLLQKGEEAKIKAATGTGGIRIIDPAILPANPIPKKTTRNAILGLILGLAMGFGIALVKEFLDNTIRSEDDITRFLKLPNLGMVPEIITSNGITQKINGTKSLPRSQKQKQGTGNNSDISTKLISHMKLRDPVTETYRSLRTNLEFSWLDKPVRTMMITSATPGDGKSMNIANLGIILAEIGRRTLIIDTDLRKPVQHKLFNIDKRPGLTNYLVGEITLEQAIQDVGIENLKVIPIGKNPPNPAEILASKKFAEFIENQKQYFDIILLDSPPIISVTDPVLISRVVDGVIFVVKFAQTDRQIAASTIETLQKSRANILGTILNATQFHRGYGYYRYYNYYNYYYSESGKGKKKRKKGN